MKTRPVLISAACCIGLLFTASAFADVVLRDSSVIKGTVFNSGDSLVIVDNKYLGKIEVRKEYLLEMNVKSPEARQTWQASVDPNTNLVFAPTAYTCPRGVFDFKDFELLFLTVSGSPTNSTILSGGFLFPISSDMQIYSFAIKQQLYQTQNGMFAAALIGQISKPIGNGSFGDISYFWNTFGVVSFRPDEKFSMHSSIVLSGGHRREIIYGRYNPATGMYYDDTNEITYAHVNFMEGMEYTPVSHVKVIVEVFDNLGVLDAITGGTSSNIYFLNFALRIFWPKIAVDIAGLRPVGNQDFGSLILIPFVNIAYRFGKN
jgi:hypothetical protein